MDDIAAAIEPSPETIVEVVIDGSRLTIPELVAVARHRARVSLSDSARGRVARCRMVVEQLVAARATVYGLTTGFGSKRDVAIDHDDTEKLQHNLIRSHACGVGAPMSEDVVRAAVLLRANTLAAGFSGVRPVVIDALMALLNNDIYPCLPEKGSVGASGDLAPLSHLVLVLMGDRYGKIYVQGGRESTEASRPVGQDREDSDGRLGSYVAHPVRSWFLECSPERLAHQGIEPIRLSSKEGLALNNGTQVMTALGALSAYDGIRLLQSAELACAVSLEAAKGVRFAFDARLHAVRPLPGQSRVAEHICAFTEGSEILSYALNTGRVQGAQSALMQAQEALSERARSVALDDEGRALRLAMLASRTGEVGDGLKRFAADPLAARDTLIDDKGSEVAHLTPGECDAETFRNALLPLQQNLSVLYRELLTLNQVLPEEDLGKPRALLGEALRQLEQAVPVMPRVQDDYSLRCAPQVLGSSRRALQHAVEVLRIEMNSVTDNPLIFPPDAPGNSDSYQEFLARNVALCKAAVISGGNFHGEPLAMVLDYLAIALAEIANISERRTALLVDGARSNGLPSLLVTDGGLNSGLMVPQYTAAALVSENKVLCHPASVDSIPTGENVEDHVSMGANSARKCREVLLNAERVVAIELLTAQQGLHYRRPFLAGAAVQELQNCLAEAGVTAADFDRVLSPLIERVLGVIRSERAARLAERYTSSIPPPHAGFGERFG